MKREEQTRRVGRFLPAYGVRLADHTALTCGALGFDKYDQVYALEVSHSGERDLVQISIGPGGADAIVHGTPHPFTTTGRFQWDFGSHASLPRTHWNLDVSYYRDATRGTSSVYQTLLAQLHLYL